MKKILLFIAFIIFFSACTNEKVIREESKSGVTGKSNGGDNIPVEKPLIESKLKKIKPLLITLFRGLKDQAKAETLVPTSTDLDGHSELVEVLLRMTHFGVNGKKVEDDILTENTFLIQDPPCLDYTGIDHMAATNIEEIGGEICFSLNQISSSLPAESEKAIDIHLLALAAHEYLHHFYSSGSTTQDEHIASLLQRYVVYQLHKYSEIDEDIITINSVGYLERFRDETRGHIKRSRQAHQLIDEEDLDKKIEEIVTGGKL